MAFPILSMCHKMLVLSYSKLFLIVNIIHHSQALQNKVSGQIWSMTNPCSVNSCYGNDLDELDLLLTVMAIY